MVSPMAKSAGVDHADDVSGIGDVKSGSFSGDHAMGAGEADFTAEAVVFDD